MGISYITAPLIGAVIGYSTNWIAIKMMFRPRKEIKIGKLKMPFTPGIIPKNRGNIAHAIAATITNNLLTEEDLKSTLLSDNIKEELVKLINIKSDNTSDYKIIDLLEKNISKENLNKIYEFILEKGSNSIYENIKDENLGHIISEQIGIAIEEKIGGTIFSILGGKKITKSFSDSIEMKVNEYLEQNGERIIYEMIQKELNKYLNVKVQDIKFNFSEIILNVYEKIIINELPLILDKLNIEKIIEDKINSMDMLELEKLILKVMKRELNAVINLGALIGFILGLLNIIF